MTPTVDHAAYRQGRIVWTLLLAALAAYYVVIRVVLAQPGTPLLTDAASMRNVFFLLSAAVVGVIVLFQRGVLPIQAREGLSVAYLRHVLCWALAESIGLYGMVLAFQTRQADDAHVFLVVAAALLVWLRPQPERFPPNP